MKKVETPKVYIHDNCRGRITSAAHLRNGAIDVFAGSQGIVCEGAAGGAEFIPWANVGGFIADISPEKLAEIISEGDGITVSLVDDDTDSNVKSAGAPVARRGRPRKDQ